MKIEMLIQELIVTKAKLNHRESSWRIKPWDDLTSDIQEQFMSTARRDVERLLHRAA